jgi:NADPH:quinone reductase-like Zn-dependent oxidoreductase
LLADKKLTTVIDRVYPFDQIQEAHGYVDSGRKRGNVILSIHS